MTYPTTFANLTSGNQPLSLFDTMFQIVGQQGVIPCSPAGTNAIVLTPGTNYYAPTVLTNGLMVSFFAATTSTTAVTVQLLALTSVKCFTALGVQANAGDIITGVHYTLQYWADLDSAAGGWIIINNNGVRFGFGPPGLGIGGSVVQTTSRTASVTLNKLCGQVAIFTATATTAYITMSVNNSLVALNDVVVATPGANSASYILNVSYVSNGIFSMTFVATGQGVGTDAPVFNFTVIKNTIT